MVLTDKSSFIVIVVSLEIEQILVQLKTCWDITPVLYHYIYLFCYCLKKGIN